MRNILQKDGMLLLIGTAFNTIAMLLMQIILARKLGVTSYGTIITSFNLINLLSLMLTLGISDYLMSYYGEYGSRFYKVVRAWLKFFPVLVLIQIILLVMIYLSGVFSKELSLFMLLIIPNIVLQGLLPLISSVFQIQGKYLQFISVNFSIYFVRLISVLGLFIGSTSIYSYGILLNVLSLIIVCYFYYYLLKFCNISEKLIANTTLEDKAPIKIKTILKKASPYAILGFCFYGFHQSNILLISIFLNEEMVALYNSFFTIITMAFILPNIIVGQLYNSKVHLWANNDFAKVKELFFNGTKKMLMIGLLIALFLLLTGEWIILLLFGEAYSQAFGILKWLLLLIPLRYMQAMGNSIMNTKTNITTKYQMFLVVSVFSIVSNIILIPMLGIIGVIITALLAEITLLLFTLYFANKYIVSN